MKVAIGLAVVVLVIVLAGGGLAWFFFVRAQDPERHERDEDE